MEAEVPYKKMKKLLIHIFSKITHKDYLKFYQVIQTTNTLTLAQQKSGVKRTTHEILKGVAISL